MGSVLTPEDQLTEPHTKGPWVLEGTGKDFVPRVCDRTNTDLWIKTPDRESHLMARRLMREEGLMCGSTSGSAMWGALKLIKERNIGKGKRCVVIFPDSIRNFMTKLLNDDWMYEQGYISEEDCARQATSDLVPNTDWGQNLTVAQLDLPDAVFLEPNSSVSQAI